MRPSRLAPIVCLVALACALALAAPSEEQAGACALQFGKALETGQISTLGPLLPDKGKVLLRLELMGPEDGYYSASQVQALLEEFLDGGSVTEFEIVRTEHDARRFALVQGRAVVTDALGRSARVQIHLAFAPEGERWILREIRETPR